MMVEIRFRRDLGQEFMERDRGRTQATNLPGKVAIRAAL